MLDHPVARRRTEAVGRRIGRALRAALLGSLPGVAMVLVAQYLIEGEMQLTVGAPGLLLAGFGAAVGFAYGLWPVGKRAEERDGGGSR